MFTHPKKILTKSMASNKPVSVSVDNQYHQQKHFLGEFTKFYDFLDFFISFWSDHFILAKWRKQIIPPLRGKILEIGAGNGKSLIYYSSSAIITAIDISTDKINQAIKKLKKINRNNITLQQANVEKLPFTDNTFDYILAT